VVSVLPGENLRDSLLKASRREEEYARELEELAKTLPHPTLKAMLEGIAGDSLKHSKLYSAAVEIVEGKIGLLSRRELEELKKAVKKHIEEEARMIQLARSLVDSTEDLRLKLILEAIYEDEIRHHALLKAIEKYIAEHDTIEEEDFWREVWEESRWESRHKTIGPRAER